MQCPERLNCATTPPLQQERQHQKIESERDHDGEAGHGGLLGGEVEVGQRQQEESSSEQQGGDDDC